MKLNLERYRWFCKDNIRVTGYILEGEKYLRNDRLADHFKNIDTIADFRKQLLSSNGQFSVIIRKGNEIWAACDRIRNYPLFFAQDNGELILSDNCYFCLKETGIKNISTVAEDAFLTAGYVPNNLTLIDNIFQIEAGSFVVFGKTVTTGFYHSFIDTPVIDYDPVTAYEELRVLLDSVFYNHLNALNDKFIAISLSGGLDSRIIAVMAKKYHPSGMLCFTYGRRNNIEARKAEKVVKNLEIKWINIEYNNDLIKDYINDSIFQNYYSYASNLTSMFFMADYFAVKYLKDNKIVPDDCVFIPGHTGGLAGSYLTSDMNKILSDNYLIERIYSDHFRYVSVPNYKKPIITDLIRQKIPVVSSPVWKTYENWNLKERQAKFIINSANVYTWFGYEYVLPLLDKSLIDFFSTLPFQLKLNKRLYHSVLRNSFFNNLNLNFNDDTYISSFKKQLQRIKDTIKPFLPYDLVTFFTDQKCNVFYDEITKQLCDNMGTDNIIRPMQSNYFNSYIIQWYLFKTKELLKAESLKINSEL